MARASKLSGQTDSNKKEADAKSQAIASEWLESDKKELNLKEFKALGEEIFKAKAAIAEVEREKKEMDKHLEELLNKATTLMQEAGLEKAHVPNFGLLYFKDYHSIPTPKEVSDKKALAKHFEKQGIFWEMFGVNSATLRAYFNAEKEKLEGDDKINFRLPGCGEPTVMTKLETKKG